MMINNLFFFNSSIIIFLILSQNDNFKNPLKTSTINLTYLEIFTWICVIIQFILLLIKIRDFN